MIKREHSSVADIVMALARMNNNMEAIREASGGYEHSYKAVKHYVGMNYDLYVDRLRQMGQETLAKRYEQKKLEW